MEADLMLQMQYKTATVSKMLGTSDNTVRSVVERTGLVVETKQAGSAQVRVFSPNDVFTIATSRRAQERRMDRPMIITTYLPKGGSAKTTTSIELAVQLQLMGFRTLLIDLDSQASASLICGYDSELDEEDLKFLNLPNNVLVRHTFYDVVKIFDATKAGRPASTSLGDVVRKPYGENGPHLITADVGLAEFEWELFKRPNRDLAIRNIFKAGISGGNESISFKGYDIIIIDCAPAISMMTRCAVVAADLLLSPVRLDALAVKSASFIARELQSLHSNGLPIPLMRILRTFAHDRNLRTGYMSAKLMAHYGASMLAPVMRQSEKLPKAMTQEATGGAMGPASLVFPTDPVVREDLTSIAAAVVETLEEIAEKRPEYV